MLPATDHTRILLRHYHTTILLPPEGPRKKNTFIYFFGEVRLLLLLLVLVLLVLLMSTANATAIASTTATATASTTGTATRELGN